MYQRIIGPACLFLAMIVLLASQFHHDPYAIEPKVIGHIRHLDHLNLDGERIQYKQYKDQWVYVTVWASWCPSCLDHWRDPLDLHGLASISLAFKDSNARAQLSKSPRLEQQTIVENNEVLLMDLGVVSAPESFLVDPHGDVVARWYGAVSQGDLDQKLKDFKVLRTHP